MWLGGHRRGSTPGVGGNSGPRTDVMEMIVVLRIVGVISICLAVLEVGIGWNKNRIFPRVSFSTCAFL